MIVLRTIAMIIAWSPRRSSRAATGCPGKSLTDADSDGYGWVPGY